MRADTKDLKNTVKEKSKEKLSSVLNQKYKK